MEKTITVEITLSGRALKHFSDQGELDTERITDAVFYGFANTLNANGVTNLDGAMETVFVEVAKDAAKTL